MCNLITGDIITEKGGINLKFKDMPYLRPDKQEMINAVRSFTDELSQAADFEQADDVFLREDRYYRHIDTLINIASIRHTIDTRDDFYDEEEKFWNSVLPELQEYFQQWTLALIHSPFRPDFERKYGEIIFLNAEIAIRAFSPEIIEQMQEENDLTQEYEKLLASAQIPFNGGTYTISQLGPFKNDPDDQTRISAWKAEGKWYIQHKNELDGIYDRLVKLRDQMARKMGYDNFCTLGYYRMQRNCYTKEDVEVFRNAVVSYLVPVAADICKEQAKRLGVSYPMSFADCALMFRTGNPKPVGDAQTVLKNALAFYTELSDETAAFFNMMLHDDLLEVLSTEGKATGAYCTSLHDYEVPFIFGNFNGTHHDVETVTHEAGHAFAGWYNRKRIPAETVWPSLEACEVHSMSMEFFSWLSAERFFGADADKFKYSHLSSALTFIPYGTMVDHFQHIVYENPLLTPEERHAEWKRLLEMYMPWLRLDGDIPFYADGMGWQRQHHIYSSPFYYIDYCLAQTVSLEIWSILTKNKENAWKHYIDYTKQGGSAVFTKLLENAGLVSPFDLDCLNNVCRKASQWLKTFDASKLR